MRFDRSRLLIALGGLAVLVVVIADPRGDKPVLVAAEPKTPSSGLAAKISTAPLVVQLPQRREMSEPRRDPFAARSWDPPPAPTPQVQAQPQPQAAPPNPYRFTGTALHHGRLKVFLADGDRVYEARPGEELDNGYRVESVNAEAVVLVHAATGTQYTIEVTSALRSPEKPAQRVAGIPDAGASAGAGP